MSDFIAALPMYDWPERRDSVDAEWAAIRDALRSRGIAAPQHLERTFTDLHELWKRPNLLFAQTCWGPLEQGLLADVQVIGQPAYDGIEGGEAETYSSAIVMRAGTFPVAAASGSAQLPFDLLRNRRFAFNSRDSMSGIVALTRDLEAAGKSLAIFSERIETGGHRASIRAVAAGAADVAAIDCRSWHLARIYEPEAGKVQVVGWTARRKGLPFITAKSTLPAIVEILKEVLAAKSFLQKVSPPADQPSSRRSSG